MATYVHSLDYKTITLDMLYMNKYQNNKERGRLDCLQKVMTFFLKHTLCKKSMYYAILIFVIYL